MIDYVLAGGMISNGPRFRVLWSVLEPLALFPIAALFFFSSVTSLGRLLWEEGGRWSIACKIPIRKPADHYFFILRAVFTYSPSHCHGVPSFHLPFARPMHSIQ